MRQISKYAAYTFDAPPNMYGAISEKIETIVLSGILFGLNNFKSKDGIKSLYERISDIFGKKIIDNTFSFLTLNSVNLPWLQIKENQYQISLELPIDLEGWSGLKKKSIRETNKKIIDFLKIKSGTTYIKDGKPTIKINFNVLFSRGEEGAETPRESYRGFVDSRNLEIDINIKLNKLISLLVIISQEYNRNKQPLTHDQFSVYLKERIEIFTKETIKDTKKTLYHELVHIGQILFGIIHQIAKKNDAEVYPGGLPIKSILKEHPNLGMHEFRDIEFQNYFNESVDDLKERLDSTSILHYNKVFLDYIGVKNNSAFENPYIHEKIIRYANIKNIKDILEKESDRKNWFKKLKKEEPNRWKYAAERLFQKIIELGYNIFSLSKEEEREIIIKELIKIAKENPKYLTLPHKQRELYKSSLYSDILNDNPEILELAYQNIARIKEEKALKDETFKVGPSLMTKTKEPEENNKAGLKNLAENNPKEFLEKYLDNPEGSEFLDMAAMNLADKYPKDFLENQKLMAKFPQHVGLAGFRLYSST